MNAEMLPTVLSDASWQVLRLWEHQIISQLPDVTEEILTHLRQWHLSANMYPSASNPYQLRKISGLCGRRVAAESGTVGP